ncbi:IclR family transcriptional regulator C-terminal domain-containing protein [Novosphingobium sp.]|uniref:IclR family transcriptional regulator domain-containing protein n=1 Tax=Novosphingobium sp. TaxID=1874826 RepID=UPI002734E687|nr:IclR family transcriptional regulator C-terminal domain-containing protein [Novosphingobium sp.]MDP3908668.1 IclR family transcriptional regulator C-terminal domain-containing protein [Novosphingobium sp.]
MAIDGRLLAVIESINDLGICTVVDLHRATGISRPAVHRIIDNLCSFGYIERVDGHSSVRLTSQILSLSAGYKPEHRMAEQAMPVLQQLQQRIRWPHTFSTPETDMMVIQATTRHHNPFVFDRGRTGLRLPILSTATGCVYLAHCGVDEREAILSRLQSHQLRDETFDETFEEMLNAARDRIAIAAEKGYALRSGGEPERTTTIAVPVIVFSTAVGALCTSFPTSAMALEEACAKYVPALRSAAESIAALFEK